MDHRWKRFEEWLQTHAPKLTNLLESPATAAEITEAEAAIGLEFPPSVRQSYRVHDGQTSGTFGLFAGWRLLPLEAVVTEWQNQREIERQYGFGDWDPDSAIPLMEDGGGNLLYVEATPDGSEHPIIEWFHEQPTRDVKAPSFEAYVDSFLDALDAGKYVYLEADDALVHESDV